MAVSCQFLSTDWGNVADWGAVVAALVVGYAVIRVSKRTNKLADAANETSRAMASLVKQQATDAEALRRREQQLILVSLSAPVGLAYTTLRSLARILQNEHWKTRLTNNIGVQEWYTEKIRLGAFRIPDSTRDRMHFLDLSIAALIVRAEGGVPLIAEALRDLQRCTPELRAAGVNALHGALTIQANELLTAWNTCRTACREAGLEVDNRDDEEVDLPPIPD